ncbi:MAG: SRPBCC domain-containing protein [Bacteroidota bacterium]
MSPEKIIVRAVVKAEKQKVWNYYTLPEHITKWNFADPSWHCPAATNDMKIGGKFFARMEAKDGSFGFDYIAIYTEINDGSDFAYEFAERKVNVSFVDLNGQTEVIITFDPETENSIELQKNGWQAILNNFKNYTETE